MYHYRKYGWNCLLHCEGVWNGTGQKEAFEQDGCLYLSCILHVHYITPVKHPFSFLLRPYKYSFVVHF